MEELIIHVEKPNNIKISVEEKNGYRYIKGYNCRKNCTTCPLYSVGELLLRECKQCTEVDDEDMIANLKIDAGISEEVVFSYASI